MAEATQNETASEESEPLKIEEETEEVKKEETDAETEEPVVVEIPEPPQKTLAEVLAEAKAEEEEPTAIPRGEENKVKEIKAFKRPGVKIASKKKVLSALV